MNDAVLCNQEIYQNRYTTGETVSKYPFDSIVSFVSRHFSQNVDRRKIRILDLGCGGGGHMAFLAKEGYEYYGIDFSEKALPWIEQIFHANGLKLDHDRFTVGDFSDLPYDSNFFDAIIDRQSVGHNLSDRLPTIVGEIFRVLKPGGIYFGVNFSDGHPDISYGRAVGNNDFGDFEKGVFKDAGFRHFFSPKEIDQWFEKFNLLEVRIISEHSVLYETGSEQILVEAQKPK